MIVIGRFCGRFSTGSRDMFFEHLMKNEMGIIYIRFPIFEIKERSLFGLVGDDHHKAWNERRPVQYRNSLKS